MAFGYAYLRMRFFHIDMDYFRREYNAWKLRRAKKRFSGVFAEARFGSGYLGQLIAVRVQSPCPPEPHDRIAFERALPTESITSKGSADRREAPHADQNHEAILILT